MLVCKTAHGDCFRCVLADECGKAFDAHGTVPDCNSTTVDESVENFVLCLV